MKKTLALLIACCLITGCSANPERYNSSESNISSSVTSENSDSPESKTEGSQTSSNSSSTSKSEPESSTPASTPTSEPQSSIPTSSSVTSSKPQSSSSKPQSSSSKPQSSSSKPQSSSSKPQSSSSKPQSSSSKPQSSSSKPQSSSSKPQSSSSKPQSSSSKPQSSSSKPQSSSSKPQSSSSKPPVEVIGPYGQRAQEAWEVEFSEEVFRLTNIERVKNGLPEFKRLPILDEVANIRAWEVLIKYGHDRPDGRSCFTAYKEAGISYSAVAENIAAGYPTPETVVDGWMNSPGHRANILNPDLDNLGVGFYCDTEGVGSTNYRYYWSQNFCSTW